MSLPARVMAEVGPAPSAPLRSGGTGARAPVSEEHARRRRPGTGVASLVLLGLTLAALGHVAVHLKHYEVALALGEARRERAALEERRRQLHLEIGVYKDPTRVMEVAREKLGLAQPSAADIVPAARLRERLSMRAANTEGAASEDELPDHGLSEGGAEGAIHEGEAL